VQSDIEATYRRYFPLLREKCRRMCGDFEEAQDVAQETFIRFWESRVAQEHPDRIVGWLYRTSMRLTIDRLRRRRAAPPSSAPGPVPSGEEALQMRQLLAVLARSVPVDELEVAVLDRIDGLTQAQSAQICGISDRTVRRLLARFDERFQALRKELAP
jgi:RNA polymerase sigma-70 factor (ECF subfamily)